MFHVLRRNLVERDGLHQRVVVAFGRLAGVCQPGLVPPLRVRHERHCHRLPEACEHCVPLHHALRSSAVFIREHHHRGRVS